MCLSNVTLDTFSLAMQGTRLLSRTKPSLMLCMRRRSLQFAISRRDFFSSESGGSEVSELLVLKLISELSPLAFASAVTLAAAWSSPIAAVMDGGVSEASRAFFGDVPPDRDSCAERFAASLSEKIIKIYLLKS